MTLNEYQAWTKQSDNSEGTATYYALGLAGETGEAVDYVKKTLKHNHRASLPITGDGLCEELGDILWYLARLAAFAGMTLEEVAKYNQEKLRARYLGGNK